VQSVGGRPRRREERDRAEYEEEGRQQAAGAPAPEVQQVDAPGRLPLREQQARDQEAAEDEERVDAQVPAARPRDVTVVEKDGRDCSGTQPVERGHVVQSGLRHRLPPDAGDAL
jgi:hypothetical protein